MCETLNPMPIEILFKDESVSTEAWAIPGHHKERVRLDSLPEDLFVEKESLNGGWGVAFSLPRKNLSAAYEFLYEGDVPERLPGLNGDPEQIVQLMGFWD